MPLRIDDLDVFEIEVILDQSLPILKASARVRRSMLSPSP
jgi:hypothetical protein